MRILIAVGVIAMALVVSASAGLVEPIPYAATARLADTPQILVDGAVYTGGDITGYGARGQYKLNDTWAVFGSVNVPEDGLGFGAGAIYALPFDLPVSSALRLGGGYLTDDSDGIDVTVMDLHAALVASGSLADMVDGLGWYVNVGAHYVKWEAETKVMTFARSAKQLESVDLSDFGLGDLVVPAAPVTRRKIKVDDSEMAMHIGAGLTFDVTDMIAVFAGVDIFTGDLIDETFIGGGVRVGLGGDAM